MPEIPSDRAKTILCYGDSNTYGFDPQNGLRYPSKIRWTGVLQKILGSGYKIIEEGCNGRTTLYDDPYESWKNGLYHLKPCLNSHKPIDLVILMLGTNDLKQYFHASAETIGKNAETLVNVIQTFTEEKQGYQPAVILVSPPEIGSGIAASPFGDIFSEDAVTESKRFSVYYRQAAEHTGCIFFDAARYIQPSPADSLHLSPSSHAVLAKGLAEVISKGSIKTQGGT